MSATSSGAGPSSSGTAPSSSLPPSNQLSLAASKGDCDAIRTLINNGVKFDADENGRTALHYAANYGKTVALKLCLQLGCELDLQDKDGCTALHCAVLDGQVDTVKVLLYEGCAVDRQDENGNTALHEAAWGGYSKIIDLLIKRGNAHVHVGNKHGHKPIHLACQNGHNQSSRILLRAGSNPNTKNNNGDTPLHVSSLFGHITCTRILISAGSNVNIKNKDGNTPLHVAAGLGKQKITKILLEAKCDTNLRNNNNITAVEMARRNNHAETVLMILSSHRLWRDNKSRHKPRKNKSSKDDTKGNTKKGKDKDEGEDDADHPGPAPRVKGRKEIKEEDKRKREEARRKTEERMLMEENYDKWRELQGTLVRQELRKQAEIHGHRHGKCLTASHSDCKACMQKLENQVEASKEKMLFELETAKARFEHKLRKMDRKMMHQAACMDRLCQERIKAEATECLHRIDKRAVAERAAWSAENDAKLGVVKDDLRGWVEDRLRDVQKQIRMLNEREGKAGARLRVRSKSENDLNADSMDETEITDTDGEDIRGIVIGRGKVDDREEEHIDGDEDKSCEVRHDETVPEDDGENNAENNQGDSPQRRRPFMRGRNVRTGKYGRPQLTIGKSRSLDREVAFASDTVGGRHNNSENSSDEEHSHEKLNQNRDFKVPSYGAMPEHSEVGGQQEAAMSERGRSSSRTSQNKRTSSFTRAVQHEMWAAAMSNNDSDGSGRAMVEATYRPPIVTVNEPHRMGSYAPDGIIPANLSSADSDSDTDTLSLTTSEDSLVMVSHMTLDSSSGTLTSPQHGAAAATVAMSHTSHQSVLQPNSRQPGSGQSESSPSTSQSSSPGDAAAVIKAKSDCSKSSSGISSAASTTFSQHRDPLDDMVLRASALESGGQNRWVHRHRPTSTMDVPPSRQHASSQYSTVHGPQQYVTSRSAYSAQQQQSQPGVNQQLRYPPPRQMVSAQPPAFRSSKPSVAGGATGASAARMSPSPSQMAPKIDKTSTQTSGQITQEQQPVFRGNAIPPKQVEQYQQDQRPQQPSVYQHPAAPGSGTPGGTPPMYHRQGHHQHGEYNRVSVQQQPADVRSISRGPMQQFAWNKVHAGQRQQRNRSAVSAQMHNPNTVGHSGDAKLTKDGSGKIAQSEEPSAWPKPQMASHNTHAAPLAPHQSKSSQRSQQPQQKPSLLKRPQSAPYGHHHVLHSNNNSNPVRSVQNASPSVMQQCDTDGSKARNQTGLSNPTRPQSASFTAKPSATVNPVVSAKPSVSRNGEGSTRPVVPAKPNSNGNNNGSAASVPQQQQQRRPKTPQTMMSTTGGSIAATVVGRPRSNQMAHSAAEGRPLSSQMIHTAGMIAQAKNRDGKPGQRPLVRRTYEISL